MSVASKGGDIIMLNRKSDRSSAALSKVEAFIDAIKSESKCCQIECDLQDFASVRAAAAKIKEDFPTGIDVLCNNAGIMLFPDKATNDGYGIVCARHPYVDVCLVYTGWSCCFVCL